MLGVAALSSVAVGLWQKLFDRRCAKSRFRLHTLRPSSFGLFGVLFQPRPPKKQNVCKFHRNLAEFEFSPEDVSFFTSSQTCSSRISTDLSQKSKNVHGSVDERPSQMVLRSAGRRTGPARSSPVRRPCPPPRRTSGTPKASRSPARALEFAEHELWGSPDGSPCIFFLRF